MHPIFAIVYCTLQALARREFNLLAHGFVSYL